MASTNTEVEGINYYTIYETPHNGNPSAPCILLVHALMSNLNMYDATVSALHAAGYATLRFDHVGHHNSPPPAARTTSQRRMSVGEGSLVYHMDDITRHMHQLVKERTGGARLKGVVGCSIGGVLALRYAMMFPEEVECVVSIAAPGIAAPEDKKVLWSERIKVFEEDARSGGDRLCRETVARWFPGEDRETEAVRAEALMHVRTCSLEGYKLLADTIRNYDYRAEVGGIRNRCLIAGGTEDGAISLPALKEIASQIQGAKYVELEKAGHLPPMQQPEKFNKLLLDMLGSA